MRPSNRAKILQAAVAVVEREGVSRLTLEAAAEEAGITKGGLLYHFETRDALLTAIHQLLSEEWEAKLKHTLGKEIEAASADERLAAYIRTCVIQATRAELLFMIEASSTPAYREYWDVIFERWTGNQPDQSIQDEAATRRTIALLAGDGLWINAALSGVELPQPTREHLAEAIVEFFTGE